MKKPTILQLGRYGDVINVLPIARRHYLNTGEKPWFVIAKEFADILEGVTYVDPFGL